MTSSKLLNIPIEKFEDLFEQSRHLTPGASISYEDEIDYRAEVKAFDYCLKKTGRNHFVSPECKPMVLEFEKVNYDISKLPANMRDNFARTYADFKNAYSNDPSKYKNSSVELYCNIYEMFNNNAISRLMTRVKKSKHFKENAFAREGLKGIESFEYYLADNVQSEELFGTIAKTAASATTLLASLNSSIHILSIILIFVAAAICILCLVNMAYNIQLAKNIEILTKRSTTDGYSQAAALRIQTSIDGMEASHPMISKVMFFKPMSVVQRFVDKNFVKNFDKFDSNLTALDKSKESLENNEQSTESVLFGFIIGFGAIMTIPIVLGFIRHIVYYINHTKLRIHLYFKEMGDWTASNVDKLIEKSLDENTSKEEKERLEKIIEKQKVWAVKLYSWADKLYKAQTEAGNETRSQIRDDESKDFDKQAADEKGANKTTTGDTSDSTETSEEKPEETPKPSSGPVAIF